MKSQCEKLMSYMNEIHETHHADCYCGMCDHQKTAKEPTSSGSERIGSENTALKQRNYALNAAVKRLLDDSWNGPIDAEHPARTYAAGLLENVDVEARH